MVTYQRSLLFPSLRRKCRISLNSAAGNKCREQLRTATIQTTRNALFFSSSSSPPPKASPLVSTCIETSKGVATITLDAPPVNSLSLDLCREFSSAVSELRADKGVRGLVVASSSPSVFCAGLDLNELHDPDPDRLRSFWRAVQSAFLDLYSSPFAAVAAVEGHAPAAGCMLAMACDHRVMARSSGATIGMNESRLGIAAPYWMAELMARTVGRREAERGLGLGLLYSPEEALNVGLVDELVEVVDGRGVRDVALQRACEWGSVPMEARVASKMIMRGKYIQELETNREKDIDDFCNFVSRRQVQESLSTYLKSLKTK